MGAYLSKPITKKVSADEEGKNVSCGASSMQGWRASQEDAHNCCIEFDENDTSLFAVYDGHGGHEVALYCAKELPNFIKNTEAYKKGDIKQALVDAFLGFDATLAKAEIVTVLKEIAGKYNEKVAHSGDEDDEENVSDLRMEAAMPLEQVMARYSLCSRANKENKTTPWPTGPSCSWSGPAWNEQDADSSSEACGSGAKSRENATASKSSNGEENGVGESSDSTEDALAGKTSETNNEETTEDTVSSSETSTAKKSVMREYKRVCRVVRDAMFEVLDRVADEDDEDEDDDDEENDETFNGSSAESARNAEDVENSSDDENDDDEEGEDDDDEDEDEDEEDEDEDEEDEDDGDFTMEMTEEPGSESGCTAVVAVLHGNELYVANAGDSRCVLCRDGEALELSLDHKPEDEPEMQRIVKAGGKVTFDGRVNGGLNLSRALGDHAYKQNTTLTAPEQMISAMPDVRHITIEPERDEFVILACDGIWNFMSSQEVINFVRPRLAEHPKNISKICEELFDHCLAPDTLGDGTGCDNMTAVIVKFNNRTTKESVQLSKKRPISPSNDVTSCENSQNSAKRFHDGEDKKEKEEEEQD